MAPPERTNYFKLVALLVDIACHVLYTYIKEKIVDSSSSFESFLNLKKEKHKLIHLYETARCCECISEPIKEEKLISRKQLLLLYKSDETKKNRSHRKFAGNKVAQICICKYTAIENIDVKILDITLAYYIINKCGKQELGVDNWTSQIREERNKLFHISDTQMITDAVFKEKWEIINGSFMGIANLISSTFAEETKKQILQTKILTVIPDYMHKYEILCYDYWKNKCAEFERAQHEEFEKKATAFNTQFSDDESMGSDCPKHMKELQNIKTRIDSIDIRIKVFGEHEYMKTSKDTESVKQDCKRVHVPGFLKLDVPASWNRTKILEYIDEKRLNRKSDMNIRFMAISPDDLNIYSEIAKTVCREIDLLEDEVKTIISGMLSRASIDTKQSAEVVVSLKVQETTEEISQIKSEEVDETVENSSSIGDDQTEPKPETDEVIPPVKKIVEEFKKREIMNDNKTPIPRAHTCSEESSPMKNEKVDETIKNPLPLGDHQTRQKYEFKNKLTRLLTLEKPVRREDNHSNDSVEQSKPKRLIDVSHIKVTLRSKIKEEEGWPEWFQRVTSLAKFSDCAIIGGKLVVLLDQYNSKLSIFNMVGSFRGGIKLPKTPQPQQISVINDNRVAVSYNREFVDLINIELGQIRTRIYTTESSLGISNLNGQIYVVVDKKNIKVINETGETIRPPFTCPSPSICYITTDEDRLLLTDPENNTLYCCDLHGSVTWKFEDETMKFPCGVTTDRNRYVYVTCQKSNNVVVVSPDGKNHKEILTVNDGLRKPNGIYYDKSSDHLLVQNYGNGDAFLHAILQSDVAPQG